MKLPKPLRDFAQKHNFTWDAKANLLYGSWQGYYFTIAQNPSGRPTHIITLSVGQTDGRPAPALSSILGNLQPDYKYLTNFSVDGYQAKISFQCRFAPQVKTYIQQMDEFIDALCMSLQSAQLMNCCQKCGSPEGVSSCLANSNSLLLCQNCRETAAQQIAQKAGEMKKRRGNFLSGAVGAILGSLLGVAAWVLVYRLGYIAAIVGLIMIVCTFKGFSLFGGKLNVPGILFCVVLSAGMLYVGEQVAIAWEIYDTFRTDFSVTFFQAYQSIPTFMEYDEFRRAVIADMAYGYLFMAAGGFSVIWSTYKQHNVAPTLQILESVTPAALAASSPVSSEPDAGQQ